MCEFIITCRIANEFVNTKEVKKKKKWIGTNMENRPRGYKTSFILNSAEHKIYPADKCLKANNC